MDDKGLMAEVMAEDKLTSLDDELRDLGATADASSKESSAARDSPPVVEADAIVVSGTGRGATMS